MAAQERATAQGRRCRGGRGARCPSGRVGDEAQWARCSATHFPTPVAKEAVEGGLQGVDKYANMLSMRNTRPISWIAAARRSFEEFPGDVQGEMLNALTIAADGNKSDKAKPFKGVDGGVFEIAIQRRGDAFRVLYAVNVGTDIWVIHAFQKKSKTGIKTPRMEVAVIRDRLRRLKEMFE